MTQQRSDIEGLTTLKATLAVAQQRVENLDQGESARLVQSRAQARAPKRSGRLAASVQASSLGKGEAQVASALVYAPVIHFGWAAHSITPNPFLETAANDSVPLVQAQNLRQVSTILGQVRGA
jgi:hypothetical protein